MSTKVFNLVIDAYVFIWWVILCNPISMLFIHWLKPKLASALAHDRIFCGEEMLKFYTKLAMLWPNKWSKWWVSSQDIKNYTAEQQVEYFLKVNYSQEVLDALSPEAIQLLIDNTEKAKKVIREMRLPNEMFHQCLDSNLDEELPVYVKKGTLPKEQQVILMEKAIHDSRFMLTSVAMDLFIKYSERCGLSKDLIEKFKNTSSGVGFMHCAYRAFKCYDQRIVVRQYHDLDTENAERDWALYLKKEGKLYVNPSLEMSPKQYDIFHKVGLFLKPEATLAFLKRDLPEMHKRIFRYEPNHGIVNDSASHVVNGNPKMKEMFERVLATEM